MPLYRPSELKEYLQSLGVSPKKRLSQNFLIDGNIIKKIIQLADVCPGESVLEIGPGPGALTEGLLEAGAHVLAVEKDPILAKHLEFLGKGEKFLRVICEDILTVDLEKHLPKGTKTKVIANLPYHLTTPILTRLIPLNKTFSSITVMVQEEVARRFAAIPGSKDYGSVTVFLQYYSEVQYGFKVSKNCFFPKPKVESAMVKFTLQPPPESVDPDKFFLISRSAFGHRRKMLVNTLKDHYAPETVRKVLIEMGKSTFCRPEELSLPDFIALSQKLPCPQKHEEPDERKC